jgi:hypothetical protein
VRMVFEVFEWRLVCYKEGEGSGKPMEQLGNKCCVIIMHKKNRLTDSLTTQSEISW